MRMRIEDSAMNDSTVAISQAAAKRRYSLTTRLVALFAATFGALLLIEIGLRIFAKPAEEMVFLSKDGSIEWDCYCSNPRGYLTPRTIKDGRTVFCVDHGDDPPRAVDLADPKFAGAFKILAVGDSFTWGLGVKLRDSWPLKLSELMSAASASDASGKPKPIVVSNRGEIGFDVAAVRETYLQATQNITPDICVYGYCLNDPMDGASNRTPMVQTRKKAADMDTGNIYDGINIRTANLKRLQRESFGAELRQYSKLLDFALSKWEWRQIHQSVVASHLDLYDPNKNADGLRITFNFIAEMNRRQREAGKQFLIVIFPMFVDIDGDYPFAKIHEQLAQHCRQANIDYLDLLPIYRSKKTADLWVHPVDQHPNEIAHRMAADAIREKIAGMPKAKTNGLK